MSASTETVAPRFVVVPDHTYGPSVVYAGVLVDSCPSVESADRIATALNEVTASATAPNWALPAVAALQAEEPARVIRALGQLLHAATS